MQYERMTVTYLEHPELSETYNRYDGYHNPVILHRGWQWHLGRFPSLEKLIAFLDYANVTLGEVTDERETAAGLFKSWNINTTVNDHNSFRNTDDLPKGAKPFTGLSNGSLVTCYLYNDGETLHIYRPNPNCPEVYKPLSIEEHIAYCRENGYV